MLTCGIVVKFACLCCVCCSQCSELTFTLQRNASDVSHFDEDYTSMDVDLSPINDALVKTLRQDVFANFDYLEPELEAKLGTH